MLLDKLKEDMLQAMKDKNTKRKMFLQVVVGEIETETKRTKGVFTDEKIEEMLFKMKKRTNDSLRLYERQGRIDLVTQALLEISILEEYLPKQLSKDEVVYLVSFVIQEMNINSIKDKGRLMKVLMPKIKGRADSKLVNEIISTYLE